MRQRDLSPSPRGLPIPDVAIFCSQIGGDFRSRYRQDTLRWVLAAAKIRVPEGSLGRGRRDLNDNVELGALWTEARSSRVSGVPGPVVVADTPNGTREGMTLEPATP